MTRLFVYGTLRPASLHPMARWLARFSTPVGPAWLRGRLYRLGGYPGAVRGAGVVHGDLLRLRHPAVLRRLDRYEGAQYRRVRAAVWNGGRLRAAWVYLCRRAPPGGMRIRSGDWFNRRPGSPPASPGRPR